MRMAAPEKLKGRLLARLMTPMLEKGLRAASVRLVEQLDADLQRRDSGAAEEPDLPWARPDGVLAGLASIP
jgi:hypothetical protein